MVLKRKQSAHSVCIVPKKPIAPRKPPSKADLVEEIKLIKELNDAMEEEIKNSDDKIAILEEREKKNLEAINKLQKMVEELKAPNHGKSFVVVKESTNEGTQTELDRPIFCYECDFPAEDYHDLGEHMMEFHAFACRICGDSFEDQEGLAEHEQTHNEDTSNDLNSHKSKPDHMKSNSCNICAENFETVRSVMIHKKGQHKDKVSKCWKFTAGNCELGDDICWFIHSESTQSDFTEIKCNLCEKAFSHQNNLMQHKKSEHLTTVKACKNASSKTCWYGDIKCWFRHDLNTDDEDIKNQNITEKMFHMMEKFTERLIALEQNSYDKSIQI